MMSKSSFWVDLKENSKRRIAVWVVSILTFMLCMPTYTAFALNRWSERGKQYIREYGALGEQKLLQKLQEVAGECLGVNMYILIFVAVIAVLAGLHGFSWLYSRKKIDFYMGMPVKRKNRYIQIWLNGILIFVIPYMLGQIINIVIATGYGAVTKEVLKTCVAALGVNLLFFLCIYHMAILAVMLTGNVLITLCAFGVFCLYEYVVRLLIYSYRYMFYRYYSYIELQGMPEFSPFIMYFDFADAQERGGSMLPVVIKLLMFALIVGAAAYICYLKRPAEAAGGAMAFKLTQPFVKILIVVPVTLLVGYLMADAVGYHPKENQNGVGFVFFALAVTVLVGSCLMQVIYEFDIKGALHKKHHILISGMAVALIFFGYRYDLTGFDSYVPEPEEVESVIFVPDMYENTLGYMNHVDEWGNYISDWEYAKDRMYMTDVEDICELVSYSMEQYDQLLDSFLVSGEMEFNEEYTKKYRWSTVSLMYRMKNGRKVTREIKVNVMDEKTLAMLDKIMSREEFKVGYFEGAVDGLTKLFDSEKLFAIEPFCGNMIYSNMMEKEDAIEFFELYREDLLKASFMEIRDNVPSNVVLVDVTQMQTNGSRWTYTVGANVYPFMEKSVAYLKEKGYYVEEMVELADVESIEVYNSNSEIREKLREEQKVQSGNELAAEQAVSVRATMERDSFDTAVFMDYYEQEKMEQIAACIYPRELLGNQWDGGVVADDDYEVIVHFKRDSAMAKKYGSSAGYGFLEGEVPQFVAEDTLYHIEEGD